MADQRNEKDMVICIPDTDELYKARMKPSDIERMVTQMIGEEPTGGSHARRQQVRRRCMRPRQRANGRGSGLAGARWADDMAADDLAALLFQGRDLIAGSAHDDSRSTAASLRP